MPHYIRRLIPRVAPFVDVSDFPEYLTRATVLTEADQDKENHNFDTWMNHFFGLVDIEDREGFLEALEQFYAEDFPKLRQLVKPVPEAPELIECCLERGLDVVVATNPIFPEIAIRERMRWAGIDQYEFAHVTTMENSHYCKPHQGYYREITERIGREPGECLMVGDDVVRDLGARRWGFATYWIHPDPGAAEPEAGYDYLNIPLSLFCPGRSRATSQESSC